MFNVVQVNSTLADALEPLGTKRKFWYTDGAKRILFKAEERGTGEDWAEKIACELCTLLGLPHVHYELAYDEPNQTPGVVCSSFAMPSVSLILGNQLLMERDPAYPVEGGKRYRLREYTVSAVAEVLHRLAPPPAGWTASLPAGVTSALDVFIGYVMLDAWIANQDRHHENWGALSEGKSLSLAPTFDHGASMARNLSDEERHERMTTRDINRKIYSFTRKARSAFYAHQGDAKPLSTLAAWQAFARLSSPAAAAWTNRLESIDNTQVHALLVQIPPSRMSNVCRKFTLELLKENRKRVLMETIR